MTRNIRNMLTIGLILITILACLSIACDESGDAITQAGNDAADAIDEWAEDAGIPACVSCEVYDELGLGNITDRDK